MKSNRHKRRSAILDAKSPLRWRDLRLLVDTDGQSVYDKSPEELLSLIARQHDMSVEDLMSHASKVEFLLATHTARQAEAKAVSTVDKLRDTSESQRLQEERITQLKADTERAQNVGKSMKAYLAFITGLGSFAILLGGALGANSLFEVSQLKDNATRIRDDLLRLRTRYESIVAINGDYVARSAIQDIDAAMDSLSLEFGANKLFDQLQANQPVLDRLVASFLGEANGHAAGSGAPTPHALSENRYVFAVLAEANRNLLTLRRSRAAVSKEDWSSILNEVEDDWMAFRIHSDEIPPAYKAFTERLLCYRDYLLGIVKLKRFTVTGREDPQLLEEAIRYNTLSTDRVVTFARSHNNLGNAHSYMFSYRLSQQSGRDTRDSSEDFEELEQVLEAALAHYERALIYRTPGDERVEAAVVNNKSNLLLQTARLHYEKAEYLKAQERAADARAGLDYLLKSQESTGTAYVTRAEIRCMHAAIRKAMAPEVPVTDSSAEWKETLDDLRIAISKDFRDFSQYVTIEELLEKEPYLPMAHAFGVQTWKADLWTTISQAQ